MKAVQLLKRLGVVYTPLTEEQIIEHKWAWVQNFIPSGKWLKAAECYCLPNDGYSDYLWHAFSFELINGLLGEEARTALSSMQINDTILLSNWEEAGYRISDASLLTASELEEIDDIVLTSIDFQWTYAKTHESDLGPYFFKVQ